MKKSKIFLLVLIWGATLIQLFINSSVDRDKRLVKEAMSFGTENVSSSVVKAYGYYGDEQLTDATRATMVKNIAGILGISDGYTIETTNKADNHTTTLKKEGKNATTIISVITLYPNSVEENSENYILVDISLMPQSSKDAHTVKQRVVELYNSLDMEPTTNLYVETQRKGMLSHDEIEKCTKKFLEDMDAKSVCTNSFDNYTCTYGYSPSIDEYVYQNDKKVNVNIIFTYDEQQNITYIHKAIPFVDKSL